MQTLTPLELLFAAPATGALPHNDAPLVPLPESRRQAFLEHLRAHARRALGEHEDLVASGARVPCGEPDTAPPASITRACATCRGHCCREGGDHAYLTEDTLLGYLARDTHADVERIVADYARHLGDEVFAGSCVFHGARGCRLPRELRSDLCNRYLCEPLRGAG